MATRVTSPASRSTGALYGPHSLAPRGVELDLTQEDLSGEVQSAATSARARSPLARAEGGFVVLGPVGRLESQRPSTLMLLGRNGARVESLTPRYPRPQTRRAITAGLSWICGHTRKGSRVSFLRCAAGGHTQSLGKRAPHSGGEGPGLASGQESGWLCARPTPPHEPALTERNDRVRQATPQYRKLPAYRSRRQTGAPLGEKSAVQGHARRTVTSMSSRVTER
jgi:hypothetical protein